LISLSLCNALFAISTLSSSTVASIPRPLVAVRAVVETERINGQFKTAQERKIFLSHLEDIVAAAAQKKLTCMDWQASKAISGRQPQAELLVKLGDSRQLLKPKIYLSFWDGLDARPVKDPFFDLEIMDSQGYAGNLLILRDIIDGKVETQFRDQSFRATMDLYFISSVMISDRVKFDDVNKKILVLMDVDKMDLLKANLRMELIEASICKNPTKSCVITLSSEEEPSSTDSLTCTMDDLSSCRCIPDWQKPMSETVGARAYRVFLTKHEHGRPRLWRHP
jgi:hypothetical protein